MQQSDGILTWRLDRVTACQEAGAATQVSNEIIVYQSARQLAEIVATVRHDPGFALAVTTAGHRRVRQEHTFLHRVETILADWQPSLPVLHPA